MSHLNGPPAIQIAGISPDDVLGRVLTDAFENVLFLPDQVVLNQRADLAVGIFTRTDNRGLLSFTKSAHDAKIPALCVDFVSDTVFIGSITLADRAGCGRCAFERRTAALATSTCAKATPLPSSDEISREIAPVIVREMRTIIDQGSEASELLDHVLAIDTETLEETLHKVIPLANCDVCGASAFPLRDREPLYLSAEDSPERVLGALAGWVDQRTGVISNLFIEPPDDPALSLPIIATAAPPHVLEKDGSLRRLPIGWGKGSSVSGAILSAVGEAIERYSASLVDPKRIVWKRPDELEGAFLDPRDCGLYTDAQYERSDFAYVRFDSSLPHPWVLGTWADNRDPVWISAIFAVLSIELLQEQSICQGTSNGLAASTDKDDASLRAILELVERDAFMTAWLTARPAERLELDDTLDPLLRTVLEGIEALGATVEVYTLPAGVIGTTVLCLALGDGDRYPGVTFGLGADLEPRLALRQAVLELGQTGPYLRRMMQSKMLVTPVNPESVREMLDHAAYYFPPDRASAFDRLRASETSIPLRDLTNVTPRSLQHCVSALRQAGIRIALIDVTSPDVATGPFYVMRAVSPDLQPIWYGHGLDRIPVARLRNLGIAPDVPPINPIW